MAEMGGIGIADVLREMGETDELLVDEANAADGVDPLDRALISARVETE